MSRIGKAPIEIPAGVTVEIAKDNVVTVKGPKGTLVQAVNPESRESSSTWPVADAR